MIEYRYNQSKPIRQQQGSYKRQRDREMAATASAYDYIVSKIHAMKQTYPSLRRQSDDDVFSALRVKAHFYKNPALILDENE